MIITTELLIILAAVLIVCLIGFKKPVWFISISYGLSISVIGLCLLILFGGRIGAATIVYCVVMIIYGIRLGGYIAYRDVKTSYNKRMQGEISDGSTMPLGVKIGLWLSCALLYMMMMAPLEYRCVTMSETNACEIIGILISIIGVIFESVSDAQKTASKKNNLTTFCSFGLFKIVRCPNYLGELIVWTGMFVTAFGALEGAGQWIIAIIGYLGIIYIMFSGARRLEIRQDKNYGADPAYVAYKEKTPILIPFIPLYSIKEHKWLVG